MANVELDCPLNYVAPALPDEASHRAAAVLTPAQLPFEVTRIRYVLGGPGASAFCNSTLAHRVEVFVAPSGTPPAQPSDMQSFVAIAVAGDAMSTEGRELELELDAPLVIGDGESLMVAVEMVGDEELDTRLCLGLCEPPGPALEGVDWWSNAAAEPYPWADLVGDFGFPDNIAIEAFGTPL